VTRLWAERSGVVTRLWAERFGVVTRLWAERFGVVTRLCAERSGVLTRLWAERSGVLTRLWAEWSTVRILAGTWDFYLLQNVQTSCGAHTASYLIGVGGYFPGIMWPGPDVDRSPQPGAEVMNEWSYTLTPLSVFMA
jgi:hypothetical protein